MTPNALPSLKDGLATLKDAAAVVAEIYCYERAQSPLPDTKPLTDTKLVSLLEDTCNRGAMPVLLDHPEQAGTITNAAATFGLNRGIFAKRMVRLDIKKPSKGAA